MGPKHIERMDDRLDAIEAALRAALEPNGRIVKRSYARNYRKHGEADLLDGVVVLVADGESDYSTDLGRAARGGTMNVLLIGHVAVDQKTKTHADVEAAELDLAEEFKAFVRTGVEGMNLQLSEIRNSRQQEFPYGWVVAVLAAGPPRATTH
jgi:hypothetical protein